MSHHGKLRENKRCENCGHFVEKRFCPECGQENIETRQRFHYLFIHFFEDFVHYDGRFWQTIKYLLFRPAKLTKEYLAGKRNRYVPPVTLYIFVSFITFFLPAVLPAPDSKEKTPLLQVNFNENKEETNKQDISAQPANPETNENKKELTKPKTQETKINSKLQEKIDNKELKKQGETDTSKLHLQWKNKSASKEELTKFEEIWKNFNKEKWEERIVHDFPKAIFIYMPFFAFWLWLFHNKKKWYYFDHGIFTLHYFSFLLLSILIIYVFIWFLSFLRIETDLVESIINTIIFGYLIYYFFHSHRLVYKESKAISRIKCSLLFFINSFCILAFIASYLLLEIFITNSVFFHEIMNFIKFSKA